MSYGTDVLHADASVPERVSDGPRLRDPTLAPSTSDLRCARVDVSSRNEIGRDERFLVESLPAFTIRVLS